MRAFVTNGKTHPAYIKETSMLGLISVLGDRACGEEEDTIEGN